MTSLEDDDISQPEARKPRSRGERGTDRRPRKCKYTPERVELVTKAIRAGALTVAQTARVAGVGRRTLFEWQQQRPDFAEAVQAAYDALGEEMLARIVLTARDRGNRDSFRAQTWLLETHPRFRDEFGRGFGRSIASGGPSQVTNVQINLSGDDRWHEACLDAYGQLLEREVAERATANAPTVVRALPAPEPEPEPDDGELF
jgi:hypothetical protein